PPFQDLIVVRRSATINQSIRGRGQKALYRDKKWRVPARFMARCATIFGAYGVSGEPTLAAGRRFAKAWGSQSEVIMARRRDPFMMALESLRARAEQGVYAPGCPVVITDEARRLNLSTTPVREALVWLSGFGLIERSPTGGFLTPRLERAIVRDRFAFRLQC